MTTATLSVLPPLLPLIISKQHPHPQAINPPRPASVSSSNSTSSAAASSLIDAHTLRQVLAAFLPSGGVIDRLGDNREKARDKARETLVVLAGLAFRGGGSSSISTKSKGTVETPLMIFERHLKEGGLGSKVWRVREQVRSFLSRNFSKSNMCYSSVYLNPRTYPPCPPPIPDPCIPPTTGCDS